MINVSVRGSQEALPRLPANAALFLNLDGMLGPNSIPRLLGLLLALRGRFQGALAIISAHPLTTVDRMFAPVLLAGAGGRGAELRLHFNQPIQNAGVALPQALQALMTQPPFRSRVPVFATDDDNADPALLLAVEKLGGLGIKLCAPAHRLPDLIAHHWLRDGVSIPRAKRRAPGHKTPPPLPRSPPRLVRPISV